MWFYIYKCVTFTNVAVYRFLAQTAPHTLWGRACVSNAEQHHLASQSFTVALPDHNIVRSPCMSVSSKDCHSLLRWLGGIVKKSLPWRDSTWWSLPRNATILRMHHTAVVLNFEDIWNDIHITYIWKIAIQLTSVGLAHAHPNYIGKV